jgi:MFS family permease
MSSTTAAVAAPVPQGKAAAVPKIAKFALLTLCLAQFINAYDTTAMNVAVSSVVKSLDTTITGVQAALTLYSLVMAAFMITGGKLGDILGRKRVFTLGVMLYGVGALTTALSPSLGVMIAGWSILEGIGSALMIPAVYAMIGVIFPAGKPRVSAYAVLGATAAAGAAMGPLLCGFLATYLSWRISFAMEVCVVIAIVLMQMRMPKPPDVSPKPKLDLVGSVLSAVGLALVVLGVLQASVYGWVRARVDFEIGGTVILPAGSISPVLVFVIAGLVVIGCFVLWERHKSRSGSPLIQLHMFKNRAVSAGLVSVMAQMFMQSGILFITPVFLQLALGYSAMETGLAMLPLTVALILTARKAPHWAQTHSPRSMIQMGLIIMSIGVVIAGMMMRGTGHWFDFVPGGLIIGFGIGMSMAPLLNLVQSAVPEKEESEISGVSRAASNLGGSLGVAVAGAVLMASLIGGLTKGIEASPFIPKSHKADALAAVKKDAQTLSNAQVRALMTKRGDPAREKAAVVVINARARDDALRDAMLAVGVIGLFGYFISFLLPHERLSTVGGSPQPGESAGAAGAGAGDGSPSPAGTAGTGSRADTPGAPSPPPAPA